MRLKNGTRRISLIQCSRKEARSGGQKDITARGGQASNLLNIASFELAPLCLRLCPFCLSLGGSALAPSVLYSICVHAIIKETSQYTSQEKSKEDRKRDRKHAKNILKKGPNGGKQTC